MKLFFITLHISVLVMIVFSTTSHIFCSSLDGTSSIVYKTQHHVFSNGENAQGFVRMTRGFTIKPGAKATLDTVISVSGSIDLRETGILQLLKNLDLDFGLTWSSGGSINGRGQSLILNDNLSIPASKIIHIIGDTVIDGNNNDILLNNNAQIIVENNATLTLRNLTIKNTRNNPYNPCLRVAGNSGKLALDHVKLAITGDMQFAQGQLYIHDDVIFSGTSALIYASTVPCFIAPSGRFLFDINTTLSFTPSSTFADQLFVLQDQTSILHLNGCTLKTTTSGMRLTRGILALENKVILESNAGAGAYFSGLLSVTRDNVSVSGLGHVHSLDWHRGNKYLAAGARNPNDGGSARIYRFDGTNLNLTYSLNTGLDCLGTKWNPAYNVVAFATEDATTPPYQNIEVFSFNESTLTSISSHDFGSAPESLDWSPDGLVLAIGGRNGRAADGFTSGSTLRLYRFNGQTLSALTSDSFLTEIYSVAWHPSGKYLAAGGAKTNNNELVLFSFNGQTLTSLQTINYGGNSSSIEAVSWNPSGTILAIGGQAPTDGSELRLYNFTGSSLSELLAQDYGTLIRGISWSPNGTTMAVGGSGATSSHELQMYFFNGTSLTLTYSVDLGTSTPRVYRPAWNSAGNHLAIGGEVWTSENELEVYRVTFVKAPTQTTSKSIVFGNSALGSTYDLNVEILGNAHVTLDGKIMDDSA